MNLYKNRKKTGYGTEEAYFAKIDRELIKNLRAEAEEEEAPEGKVIEAADRFQQKNKEDQEDKKAA